MGPPYADLVIENSLTRHCMNVRSLVDSGSVFFTVPERLAIQLGYDLVKAGTREVVLADGSHQSVPMIGPLRVYFANRYCDLSALVLGDEPLLVNHSIARMPAGKTSNSSGNSNGCPKENKRTSPVKKRIRRTKVQCGKDSNRVTRALCACGRATDLTNRDLSNLTGLAPSRVQVILGRLDDLGGIARHTTPSSLTARSDVQELSTSRLWYSVPTVDGRRAGVAAS